MRLCLAIPVLDSVGWRFFLHVSALVGKLARKYELELCYVNRSAIDRARELSVKTAIAKECDYLLFIDDDTIIPFDTVDKLFPLLEEKKDAVCASGFCYQRGYKYMPMVYKYENFVWGTGQSCQLLEPFPTEPFRVSAVGMGVSLLKVELLKKLGDKLGDCFGRDGGGTEDFYFFAKAYQMEFTTWVDPSVEATHLGNPREINSSVTDRYREEDHCMIYLPNEDGGRAYKGELKV